MISLVRTYEYSYFFLNRFSQLAVLGDNDKNRWIAYCPNENIELLLKLNWEMTLCGGNKENIIIEDMMSVLNFDPDNNWIKIYNTKKQEYIQSYDVPILIREKNSIGNNYYLCTKKNKYSGETLLSFNPFTQEIGWEIDFQIHKNKIKIIFSDQNVTVPDFDNASP